MFLDTATAGRLGRLGGEVSVRAIRIRIHVVPIRSARVPSAATQFSLGLGFGLGSLVRRRSVVTTAVIIIFVVMSADQVLFIVVARTGAVAGLFRRATALLAVGCSVFVVCSLLTVSPAGPKVP